MKLIFKILTIAILAIFLQTFNAAAKKPRYTATIEVVLDVPRSKADTLQFEVWHNDLNSSYYKNTLISKYAINETKTRIKLSLPDSANYVRLTFFHGLEEDLIIPINVFLFEREDSLTIHLNDKGCTFEGRSAGKYQCQLEIYEALDKFSGSQEDSELLKSGRYAEAIESIRRQEDRYYSYCLEIIERFKKELGESLLKVLKVDARALADDQVCNKIEAQTSWIYRKKYFERFKETLRLMDDSSHYRFSDSATLVFSFQYCDYLIKKESILAEMKVSSADDEYNRKNVFSDLITGIQKKYKGIVLSKMIFLATLRDANRVRQTDWKGLQIFLAKTSPNIFTKALKNYLANASEAAPAFAFELPDVSGKIRTLKEFKGKLVVMDFWFTGCSGCADLAKELKPIVAGFSGNRNLVFISVCVDKDRQRWLTSVEQEKYCSKDEINLFTEGKGWTHDIVKHYNITSYPRLLVISKNGRIVSTAPPIPRAGGKDAFINYLKEHL
jgi:peroxiredoxin